MEAKFALSRAHDGFLPPFFSRIVLSQRTLSVDRQQPATVTVPSIRSIYLFGMCVHLLETRTRSIQAV